MMLHPDFLSRAIAHRGLWSAALGRPENSIPAARAAVEAGYGIELDLQLSADGRAMVFHDDTLDRLTGEKGWVFQRTAEELGRLGLSGTDQPIPTFPDLLDAVAGRVPLLIELKDQTAHPGGTLGPLEEQVARDLKGYTGPAALMSFHPGMIMNLSRLAPGIPRGLIGQDFAKEGFAPEMVGPLNDYAAFDASQSCFVSHDWHSLRMPSVARLKARGVPILCWTTRSEADEAEARKIADNVTFEGYLPA